MTLANVETGEKAVLEVVPEPFDLRGLILDALQGDETSPAALVEVVFALVPRGEWESLARWAVLQRIRLAVKVARSQALVPDAKPVGWASSGDRAPSARWAAAGPLYHTILSQRVAVGDDEWKFLGDCTRDDISQLVESRKAAAAAIMRIGKRYAAVVALFDKHAEAKRVADLPMPDLAAVFA